MRRARRGLASGSIDGSEEFYSISAIMFLMLTLLHLNIWHIGFEF